MTAISSAAFLAPAAAGLPRQAPPVSSLLALATLGIVNTGLAYWFFYLLIDEAGAAAASVITYVMPVVALLLVGLPGEQLTIGAIAGPVPIALGAWLATGRQTPGTAKTTAQGHPTQERRNPAQRHRRAAAARPSSDPRSLAVLGRQAASAARGAAGPCLVIMERAAGPRRDDWPRCLVVRASGKSAHALRSCLTQRDRLCHAGHDGS